MSTRPSDPNREDAASDARTYIWLAAFMVLSLLVRISSYRTEWIRSGGDRTETVAEVAVYETSSTILLILLIPLVAWFLSRGTPGVHDWKRVAQVNALGSLIYSIVHVTGMVIIRKIVMLTFFDRSYIFTDDLVREFFYEYRKDIYTYMLVAAFLLLARQLAQQDRELQAIHEQVKKTHRLALKCGGQTIWVDAASVQFVKSAGNYVEVHAAGAPILARATLTAVETMLRDAGVPAVRAHRSYVVNRDHVAKTAPTGEGDLEISLQNGTKIPGSRRYRDAWSASS